MQDSPALGVIGLALTVAGLAFAMWARRHLGKNWSAVVTIRTDHELIRTGPYRFIRHPIYTGILLAMIGTALLVGEVRALLAVAIMALSFFFKARKEEVWLAREFGDKFEAHTKHTGMFLPKFS